MKRLGAVIVLVVLCVAGLFGALYWPGASARHGGATERSKPNTAASRDAALGQFTPVDPPRPAPELGFTARDGAAHRLADFRGRVVLVNLWATWCAPCVREMPSLDHLQAMLGDRLSVLAISEDRGGAKIVEPFLAKLGLERLAIYLDPSGAAQQAFAVRGLPTSFLIDGDGRIRARLEGAATWDAPSMVQRLEGYLPDASVVKTSAKR
jgi:thiol-disulfide isomerase/thioredoxin